MKTRYYNLAPSDRNIEACRRMLEELISITAALEAARIQQNSTLRVEIELGFNDDGFYFLKRSEHEYDPDSNDDWKKQLQFNVKLQSDTEADINDKFGKKGDDDVK